MAKIICLLLTFLLLEIFLQSLIFSDSYEIKDTYDLKRVSCNMALILCLSYVFCMFVMYVSCSLTPSMYGLSFYAIKLCSCLCFNKKKNIFFLRFLFEIVCV